jgi:TonB family protein
LAAVDDPEYTTAWKFSRMSPAAAASSALLHVMVAMAMLPAWPQRHTSSAERAIEITVELPARQNSDPVPPSATSPGLAATPPPAPEPSLERSLPRIEAPPPPTRQDFAKAVPSSVPKAATPQPAAPRSAPSRSAEAGAAGHRKAQQDYLWQIIRKLSQHRFYSSSREASEQGTVVTRMTVARDGRLIDVSLARSSGFPGLDKGVLDTIREASPFAPLPAGLADDRYTFIVPINYVHER